MRKMSCRKPNWQLLKECGEKLTKEGRTPFTRRQLIECVQKEHPDHGESTLNPMIQGMTVNLKGGAPGAIDKEVFYSVAKGQFVLYDPKKHSAGQNEPPPIEEKKEKSLSSQPMQFVENENNQLCKTTENDIRDMIMQILFQKMGKDGTWHGAGSTAVFDLKDEYQGFKCYAERGLSYHLPNNKSMTHKSDILITNEELRRHISIEIKHRSSVTDQFKCRNYDMSHLKETYGYNILGILVYVKTPSGISIEHAKEISYSYDHFIGIMSETKFLPIVWDELIGVILKFIYSTKRI